MTDLDWTDVPGHRELVRVQHGVRAAVTVDADAEIGVSVSIESAERGGADPACLLDVVADLDARVVAIQQTARWLATVRADLTERGTR